MYRMGSAVFFFALMVPMLASAATCPTLSLGSTGADVSAVQKILFDAYEGFPSPTAYFGKTTQAAVKQWQKEHGIDQTGSVGPRTRSAMNIPCVATVQTTPASSSTTELLKALLAQLAILQERIAVLKAAMGSSTIVSTTTPLFSSGGGGSGGGGGGSGTITPTPASSSCSLNGQTITSGGSITAYQSSSVGYGSQCVSETRMCANGVLSGSFSFSACSVGVKPVSNQLVWFSPLPPMPARINPAYTGSDDFMSLFDSAAPWQTTASHVQVFKLYGEWLLPSNATDSQLQQIVSDLKRRGIKLAVEAGPLTPTTCGNGIEGFAGVQIQTILARIKAAGGTLDYISMDEPYYYGHVYSGTNACNWSADKVAQGVKSFIDTVHGVFPNAIVGDTEPHITGNPAVFQEWFDAFKRVNGYALPFIHLDVQWGDSTWLPQAKAIQDLATRNGVQFGLIYNGDTQTTDADWILQAGEHVKMYEIAGGYRPDHVLFQSWNDKPDRVLPETQPNTFTNFINRYFSDRSSLGRTTGTGNDLAYGRTGTASQTYTGTSPSFAFDGEPGSIWSSGASSPQWIQIDLGAPHAVREIRMLTSQSPAGHTTHYVYGSTGGPDGPWRLITVFDGITDDGQMLDYVLPAALSNVRYVRVQTQVSPSWVGWREIEIVDAGSMGSNTKMPIGYFDGIDANFGGMWGWTYDPDAPAFSNNVEVYVDGPIGTGQLVATLTADVPRSDVNAAAGISGSHGFTWTVPAQYRLGTHTWYLYGIDVNDFSASTLLIGSPRTY